MLGIGGSGFPANSGIVLRFADGVRPFAIATTNESGVFLIEVEVPVTEGAGDRVSRSRRAPTRWPPRQSVLVRPPTEARCPASPASGSAEPIS